MTVTAGDVTMTSASASTLKNYLHTLQSSGASAGDGKSYRYFGVEPETVAKLPFTIRVLLETAIRNCDGLLVTTQDVERLLDWQRSSKENLEFAYKPARVLLQDFTGVPAVVDLAAMRDAVSALGGDPSAVNPLIPTDLVVDHSVSVDFFHSKDALMKNEEIEFQRNRERFAFLKWGQKAFDNMLVVPPGSGIVHQVNLEYLARVVFKQPQSQSSSDSHTGSDSSEVMLYPDSVVGTDSHTPMIAGLGVLGWGVGGIEAEAVMLGQPIYMVVPEVIGFKLSGSLPELATATDLVLKIAQMLRAKNVVGKFVEFYGDGVQTLTVADRATISNMSPEFGCTVAYFPCDAKTFSYLRATARNAADLELFEAYMKEAQLFRSEESAATIEYTDASLALDLATITPAVAGPKRPHDYVPVASLPTAFSSSLSAPVSFKGFGLPAEELSRSATYTAADGSVHTLRHGSVVLAAITSCTNTSNPSVMLQAGMIARNALAHGLRPPAYVKCSLSPGSHVVHSYLKKAELLSSLEALNFYLTGFGCQTCIGNSGDLDPEIAKLVMDNELVAGAVLSGNRNFEGRIHPLTRANFLASPPLVVAYALAGVVDIDFATTPLGTSTKPGSEGHPVFLKDIWPSAAEVSKMVEENVTQGMFREVYSHILEGNKDWQSTPIPEGKQLYPWDASSTYVHNPPFFQGMSLEPPAIQKVEKAYCLLSLGDSITTDHISPAGKIALNSPAAKYLEKRGVASKDFNSYGSRRGNDEVMVRGTFANIRIMNKMVSSVGPTTLHVPSGKEMPVFDAAELYRAEGAGHPLVILAGAEYGSGSSRDWAAKGPMLQNVKIVIAQSYERIHRSNLVGMGILPLQFNEGEGAEFFGISGKQERFTVDLTTVKVGNQVEVTVHGLDDNSPTKHFSCRSRVDTDIELQYLRHGGILKYVLRKMAQDTMKKAD